MILQLAAKYERRSERKGEKAILDVKLLKKSAHFRGIQNV